MYAQGIKPLSAAVFAVKKENGTNKYLLVRRCDERYNGNWQRAGGGIQEGEAVWQAALRELFEETGLKPSRFYSADVLETFYYPDRDAVLSVPVFVAFIDDAQQVTLSPEHDMYAWATYHEALEMLDFDCQRRALQHIEEYFVCRAPNKWLRIPV